MKGSPKINARLNAALGFELTAINQYFLHARILANWGFKALGKVAYANSIAAMKEADRLIERLLFLEGMPSMLPGKLLIGKDVPATIKNDLSLEIRERADLVTALAECEEAGDYVSRDLILGLLKAAEGRIDYHETQLGLIEKIGLENYQQTAIGETEE
jgi:bacterioferritin